MHSKGQKSWQVQHPRLSKTNLNYNVTVHYKEKTEEINRSIGKLSHLTGALAIHVILIGSDLSIKKKHLPTDPFYKSVQIKESRKKSSVVTPLLDNDEEMELEKRNCNNC